VNEQPCDLPPSLPADWQTKRDKKRTRYSHPNSMFLIDLTRVWSYDSQRTVTGNASFEIEFEFAVWMYICVFILFVLFV
jgi:hypothetical protein